MKFTIAIFIFLASLLTASASINVTNYGMVDDGHRFIVLTTSNSPMVSVVGTNRFGAESVGKVIEVFNASSDLTHLVTNRDTISLVTNYDASGTNIWGSVLQQRTGQYFCIVGTNNGPALQKVIDTGEWMAASNGTPTTINVPYTGGFYLCVESNVLNPNYTMTSKYDAHAAAYIYGGGLNFVGETGATLMGCGAGMTHFESTDSIYIPLRDNILFIENPATNTSLKLTFNNLIFDGGVTNGYTPAYFYFPPDGNGAGWDATHDAMLFTGSGGGQINSLLTNCTIQHWRGEMLKASVGSSIGTTNLVHEIVNCVFDDGVASCINLTGAMDIHSNVFKNVYFVQEFYRDYSTNRRSYFRDNVVTNVYSSLAVLTLNGGFYGCPFYTISNNIAWLTNCGLTYSSPSPNVEVLTNTIFGNGVGSAFSTGAAGYQSVFGVCNSNMIVGWNTVSNMAYGFSENGPAPSQLINSIIASNTFDKVQEMARGGGAGTNVMLTNNNVVNWPAAGVTSPIDGTTLTGEDFFDGGNTYNMYDTHWYSHLGASDHIAYAHGRIAMMGYSATTFYLSGASSTHYIPDGATITVTNTYNTGTGKTNDVYLSDTNTSPVASLGPHQSLIVYRDNVNQVWTTNVSLPPASYTLTVINGTVNGGSSATGPAGTQFTIIGNTGTGHWSADANIANVNASTTTYTMPASDSTATWNGAPGGVIISGYLGAKSITPTP